MRDSALCGSGRVRKRNEALILAASEALFAEHGFKGTSVAMIAARAGLPKANLHYYFGSKQALYKAVLQRILQSWQESLDRLGAEDDPAQSLPRYIRERLEFSWRHPDAARVFAMEMISGGSCMEELLGNEFQHWFAGRVDLVRCWVAGRKIAPVEPVQLMLLLCSSIQHYTGFVAQIASCLGLRAYEEQSLNDMCSALTTIILKGCGAGPEGARQSHAK